MSFAGDEEVDQPLSQVDENQQGGTGLGQAQPNPNPGNQGDSAVSLGGGGSGVASPGGGNVGGAAPAPKAQSQQPSSSGSWTNLQDYLDANSDQAQQMGSQISSNVSNAAQNAESNVNSAASDFQNQVNANTVNQDQNAVSQAISDAQNATAGGAQNQQDVTNFQNQANASYNGPTDFTAESQYGSAQGAVNNAQQQVKEAGSEAGREVLLQNQYGGNGSEYNQGEQNLDQLLLQNNPQNEKTFQGLQNQWAGLGQTLSNATTQEDQAAQNAAATDQATAQAAQQALSTANTNFQNTVQGQLTNAQQAYQQENANLSGALTNGQTLTADELAALGLSGDTHTWGLNGQQMAAYLTPGTNPTLYNTATADQYAQAAALAALAGQSGANFLPTQYASQAGSAGPAVNFNKAQFQSDAAARQTEYNNEASQVYQQAIQNLTSADGSTFLGTQPAPSLAQAEANPAAFAQYYQNQLNQLVPQDYQPYVPQVMGNWNQLAALYSPTMTLGNMAGHGVGEGATTGLGPQRAPG